MAVNLNDSLRWKTANADEKEMLDDLQGNILKGHGREHTVNIFLQFTDSSAKSFVKKLATHIISASDQLNETEKRKEAKAKGKPFDSKPFVAFFLSGEGYKVLGLTAQMPAPAGSAFGTGLKSKTVALKDPQTNKWDGHFQQRIDAMILIGDEDAKKVKAQKTKILALLTPSIKVLGEEIGLAMKNENGDGIEHFGYVDGRSQPLLLKEDVDNEKNQSDGINLWSPDFPLKQVLVPCPGGNSPNSFGSFFVFRKLEQNVKDFKAKEEKLADKLGLKDDERELAGAMIVGRFEDGTPVVLQKGEGMHNPVPNNFNYEGDLAGNKCPFHAHIRKTNPRGDSVNAIAPNVPTLEGERSHIMARRGITYGKRKAKRKDGRIIEFKDTETVTGNVGLLFMAYQNSIERQFEFTQSAWANNESFVKDLKTGTPQTGLDPVIGQLLPTESPLFKHQNPTNWGESTRKEFQFDGFVKMKGGEYFFAPCLSFLKSL